jgi:hypothetical protein
MERRASYTTANGPTVREDGLWQAYSADSDPALIPAAFTKKYGYPMRLPLRKTGGGWLAGPVREAAQHVNHYDPPACDGQDG